VEFHDPTIVIGKVFDQESGSQMKLPNFGSPSSDGSSKIGRHLSNKAI
jgi:hypothetical protein